MPKRVLITGLCGFIGHHVAAAILKQTDWEIVGLDRIDETSTLHRLSDLEIWESNKQRVKFVWHDLKAELNDYVAAEIGKVDYVLHLAASTHVDRSITNPREFVLDNVLGTCNLLEWAKSQLDLQRFVYFSTDEVFGPAPLGVRYQEWACYRSSNPYAASKAGGEELALAFENTYGLPVIITHTVNVFGERQHPEKYIPNTIRKIRLGEQVLVHADPTCTQSGSRFYIHARNVAAALLFLLEHGEVRQKYNITGEREVSNLEVAELIAKQLDAKLRYELVNFHGSRPGHDLRYALDGERLWQLGFRYAKTFDESLAAVVRWSMDHPKWLGL